MRLFLIFHDGKPIVALDDHQYRSPCEILDKYSEFSGLNREFLTWGIISVLDTEEIMK